MTLDPDENAAEKESVNTIAGNSKNCKESAFGSNNISKETTKKDKTSFVSKSSSLSKVLTVSKWEMRRFSGTMSKRLIPAAVILFIALIFVSGFAQMNGLHIEDNIYTIGSDTKLGAMITAPDSRFTNFIIASDSDLQNNLENYDLVLLGTKLYVADTEKANAALLAFEHDYSRYVVSVYNRQEDLYAAYPLWVEEHTVESEIDFTATQMGQMAFAHKSPWRAPKPQNVIQLPAPSSHVETSIEELRSDLIADESKDSTIQRYTDVLTSSKLETIPYKVPIQMSASLPFDTIVLVFVFIFPLYFTSQFFMMSIMNERIERRGENLLSTPIKSWQIILGKGLPYFLLMLGIAFALTLLIRADLIILLPLIPIILFFLSAALIIAMIARSFKELSFISIFFSTVASSYIFFPAIFANIHVISLVSPLTLIIYQMQGDGFTLDQYIYSTIIFYLISLAVFYLASKNFNEEKLFNYHRIIPALLEFADGVISKKWVNSSIFGLTICLIPFVFMVQLMLLVVLFNIPMPLSLILIMIGAAVTEEIAKSIGVYSLASKRAKYFTWKNLAAASFATALGFLIGEKLLLFATLAEISDSVFGAVIFSSLSSLWMPLVLHFVTVFAAGSVLKLIGTRAYLIAIIIATAIHTAYNLIILGVI